MRRFRGLGRWAGAVLWAVALLPALALAPAAVLDRGPDGSVRPALFPSALAAFDPYVWECVRNSLAMAAAVTLAARVVGVGLARVAVRRRFWGRSPLAALAVAGLAVPPAFGALGLRALFGPPGSWAEAPGPTWLTASAGWAAWFWVATTAAAPLVALAAASALSKVDPAWEDAAALAGAGPWRVWRRLVWPVVRPEVARSLAAVFTLTLLEPGAPLVLGLRRTLAFQVVGAALADAPGNLSRAAVLALAAVLLAGGVRVLLGWWGGVPTPGLAGDIPPPPHPRAASWSRGAASALVMALAAAAVWAPVYGLLEVAVSGRAIGAVFRDPVSRGYLVHSALLGLAVMAVDVSAARFLAAWAVPRKDRRTSEGLADRVGSLPPLAVGVGALALPWVLRAAASSLRVPRGSAPLGRWLDFLVDALDSDRTPWAALVLAVAVVRLPLLVRSAAERQRALRPSRIDAALTLGATPRQARRTLSGRWLGVSPSAALLTTALAATNVAPALVLSPAADARPVGPAVLTLLDEPGAGLRHAAGLASVALAVNLAALALAARSRSGLLRTAFPS